MRPVRLDDWGTRAVDGPDNGFQSYYNIQVESAIDTVANFPSRVPSLLQAL